MQSEKNFEECPKNDCKENEEKVHNIRWLSTKLINLLVIWEILEHILFERVNEIFIMQSQYLKSYFIKTFTSNITYTHKHYYKF